MKPQLSSNEELRLLKLRQVMAITGLARSTVYKYCAGNN